MHTSAIHAGDIIYANKRGRLFHAKVINLNTNGKLRVEPIEHNISYRHIQTSEITEHWTRNTTTRRTAPAPNTQPTLQLPLAL